MKKLLVTVTALVACVGVIAQGQLNFGNDNFTLGYNAIVTDADGVTPLGGDFWAQMYVGADASSLAPVGSPVAFFDIDGFKGMVSAGTVVVPGIAGGADAVMEMRAWEASGGNTYDAAEAAGVKVGKSNQFTRTLGGGTVVPVNLGEAPGTDAATNLQGFSVVPEPSTMALGLLGAAVLLLRRRK